MKLLRHLVAFAFLVSTYGRPLRSLLGVRQTPNKVSLDSATDKLQGVLDAVTGSISKARGGYSSLKTVCVSEFQASSKRVQAQIATLAELETSRQLNLERTAGLEASLANLVSQETEAHSSYENAVSQRGAALQKHLSSYKSSTDQANAVGEVLEMMKQKKAQTVAAQESTKDMKVVPPVSPTASASSLDYVIGVMSNMKESSLAKAAEGADSHNKDDSDLEKLVTSYKTSLQHIDKQYQTENARRMEAKVAARDQKEEKTLRNMLVDGEQKLGKEFNALCGADGKGGSVPAAMEAAEYLLTKFDQQAKSAVNIMDTLPDLQSAAASLLAIEPHNHLRGSNQTEIVMTHAPEPVAVAQASKAVEAPESAQESAARWVIAQAARFKDNATQHFASAVAASFPNGVPPPRPHPVRIVAPSRQLHTLVGTNRTRQTATHAVQADAKAEPQLSKEAAEVVACMKDKQDLTDKIIAARKAARVARTDRMSAEGRVKAVASFQKSVDAQKVVLTDASKSTEAGFKPLRDLVASKSVSTDLTDAIAEMATIEKDVKAYIDAGGPPGAAGLPTALEGIKEVLNTAKARLDNDMKVLDGAYTGAFAISYPALITQLVNKGKDLAIEEDAMKDAVKVSDLAATKEETAEKDLMVQRAGVEYRCLQPGQCGNLRYQQCCSGSGTHMKKVMSWSECAAHCEAVVKEGQQIAGCEMTDLAKEDDRTGSGTCFAHTTCDIKPSKLKCAGSLCKAKPAST